MKSKLNPNAKPWYPSRPWYPKDMQIINLRGILNDIIPADKDLLKSQGGLGTTPIDGLKATGNFAPKFKLKQTDNRY